MKTQKEKRFKIAELLILASSLYMVAAGTLAAYFGVKKIRKELKKN